MSENREPRRAEAASFRGIRHLDPKTCYRALETRDERFDGRIFVGVTSTGIYCRPVCPAKTARFENTRFFTSAAAAQEAGFRPCLRCRPETAPDLGSWRGTSNTVSRGLELIAGGALDGEAASVDSLAERLGVGARQLRRLFDQHLGASPITVAQTRRVLFAKQLIHETRLPMTEIALAAGFGSVRRFNETFRDLFGRPPGELRRRAATSLPSGTVAATGVTVRLRYRPPYDWEAMLGFLRARAIEGVEHLGDASYSRTFVVDGMAGSLAVAHVPDARCLAVTVRSPSVRTLPWVVARVRRVFDLGADVSAIGEQLSRDPFMGELVRKRPGLRVPGGFDGFELAVRAVLGQQITVEAARKLASRLSGLCGSRVALAERIDPSLDRAFPSAGQVAEADLSALAMPAARRETLSTLARAAVADPSLFLPLDTVEETIARLRSIKGIGEWSAAYIALRAAREPDAFPASDVGLLRGASLDGARPGVAELSSRAERWRPWRAYAAQHLWAADASGRGSLEKDAALLR